jgi:hypothetical protein
VTAIVILSEHENLPDWAVPPEWATRLLAEGIEFRHVSEELEIAQICAEQLMV